MIAIRETLSGRKSGTDMNNTTDDVSLIFMFPVGARGIQSAAAPVLLQSASQPVVLENTAG